MGTSNPARIRYSPGGAARNVAENLARLGQPVILLSVVGDDPNGDHVLKHTQAAGVNVDYILRSQERPTGAYLGMVGTGGDLQLAVDDMRLIAELTPEHIRQHESLFRLASVLMIDANLPKDTLRTVISLARKAKLPVCADPTSTTLAEKLKPHLKNLFMLTLNIQRLFRQPVTAASPSQAIETAKMLVSAGVTW
jgi:pseudouridine kinase